MHGPAELDYIALSEPLVNILATIRLLGAAGWSRRTNAMRWTPRRGRCSSRSAPTRTCWGQPANCPAPRRAEIAGLIGVHRRDLKREEAAELVSRVAAAPDRRVLPPRHWRFEETQIWRELVARWRAELGADGTANHRSAQQLEQAVRGAVVRREVGEVAKLQHLEGQGRRQILALCCSAGRRNGRPAE